MSSFEPLEELWDALLSRQPDQVRAAFQSLDVDSRQHVWAHLERMTQEEGWQEQQRMAAQAALAALKDLAPDGPSA